MNRLLSGLALALFALPLVACAADLDQDGDRVIAEVSDDSVVPDAVLQGQTAAPTAEAASAKDKGKDKDKQTFLVVKLEEVFVSSY